MLQNIKQNHRSVKFFLKETRCWVYENRAMNRSYCITGEDAAPKPEVAMYAPHLSGSCGLALPSPWRFMVVCLLLLYLLFGLNGKSLFAQTAATGALRGSVSDPSGGVLPGVSIKVTSTTTEETRTAITQGNGAYLIPLLSPGAYRVEASSNNFKTAVFEDVRVDITETKPVDMRLQIGSTTESVTVKAEPPQLETTSSALGHVTD